MVVELKTIQAGELATPTYCDKSCEGEGTSILRSAEEETNALRKSTQALQFTQPSSSIPTTIRFTELWSVLEVSELCASCLVKELTDPGRVLA